MQAAAVAAGVDRTTVHRWLRADLRFHAAYNALRRDLQREAQARLAHLIELALETVCSAIQAGDVRAALAVLRGTGLLSGEKPQIGAEDPEELHDEASAAAQARAFARTLRRCAAQ